MCFAPHGYLIPSPSLLVFVSVSTPFQSPQVPSFIEMSMKTAPTKVFITPTLGRDANTNCDDTIHAHRYVQILKASVPKVHSSQSITRHHSVRVVRGYVSNTQFETQGFAPHEQLNVFYDLHMFKRSRLQSIRGLCGLNLESSCFQPRIFE